MKPSSAILALTPILLLVTALPTAEAHRAWMLPSSTVLSGEDPWITVDAARSNDLFYFDHNASRLDNLTITTPDGSTVPAQNPRTGKFRSSFDVKLAMNGTYRISIADESMFARYTENGESKRWRGNAARLQAEVPADAQNLQVTQSHNRVEVFVTAGAPTETVFKPEGQGLELVPITHPNDLFAGETARMRFVLDGAPAAGLTVTIIREGIRYRDALQEITTTTGENGEFEVTWPYPGMYWLNVSVGGRGMPGGAGPSQASTNDPQERPARRASYSVTLEVLPQ